MVVILPKAAYAGSYLLRRDLPVLGLQFQDFVTACLDRTGFVGTDVTGTGRDDTLVGVQHGIDDSGIGLCAADQEEDIRFRGMTCLTDLSPGRFGILITAVAGSFLHIGFQKAL